MSDAPVEVPHEESPEKLSDNGRFSKPKRVAAGVPAVVAALADVVHEAGVFRGGKALFALNQKGGFDCPSCAWPDPDDDRSPIAEYCENGAKAVAEEATQKKLTPDFFSQNSVAALAELSDYEIGKKGRVAQPMYLPRGATHYQGISWDDAFRKIGDTLNALASPDEAIFYTSGRTSNEAAFLYQLFVREYGTNNLPDCSNMCHESSGSAMTESIGFPKGTVTLNDFYETEVIVIMGQNPGTNHPRMLTALQRAKKNGATIIAVNPLPEAGLLAFNNPQQVSGILGLATQLADIFLQVRINGDMALLKAVMHLLLEAEDKAPGTVLDGTFIETQTTGFAELAESLRRHKLDDLAEAAGVPLQQIRAAADVLAAKKRIIVCWAMGLTQHKNAVETIQEVINLLLMKGSIGKPGAGACPVRGHSNVQGDRTVGIYEKISDEFRGKLMKVFGFEPPKKNGFHTVDSIHAMHDGRAKVFFAMGGNFLSATPDTGYTAAALRRCKLTVHVSTKLNRSHFVHGEEALILPCLSRSDRDTTGGGGEDQFVSCENSVGVIQMSKGILKPISNDLLSEPAIVCRLARATLGARSVVDWAKYERHYDAIRDDIERCVAGFDRYNERVRKPGGFYLPNHAREGHFHPKEGKKACFHVAELPNHRLEPGEYWMMTIRSHDQFNTTIYGLQDRYRGVHNERRVVFMNEADVADAGLKRGDVVDLISDRDGIERVARQFLVLPYSIPRGCTATYFPETNVLVPIGVVADKSATPVSKHVAIRLRRREKSSSEEKT